ncbi:MAG TPA: crosslink repair DNA glycosylase YcaQ family protein [Steroidobacteraceae bacterium]|nr:crosslink repair DNA glycosylase YcaQ family protein [Steroidobacteraceae bacterium]
MTPPTLDDLRRYAIARSLFRPTTLLKAINRLGFVQADPIRAPARAQDLTLRHRVTGYRAGDLERRYARLPIEEDFFVNYGFLPRELQALMHPRTARKKWTKARWKKAHEVLEFVRAHGVVHPRAVDARFAHGKVKNWFGGSSNASTQLLDGMHYRGLLRIARREGGIRLYAARETTAAQRDVDATIDRLVDVVVNKYAPLPARTLSGFVYFLRHAVPQWHESRKDALVRAMARLPSATVDGQTWYWPAGEDPRSRRHRVADEVRLFSPFDPVVWDRQRFETFWGWPYRFEAYTPAVKRVRGYYALPLLWRNEVIGWGNLSVVDGRLVPSLGYQRGRPPRDREFRRELEAELARIEEFLT